MTHEFDRVGESGKGCGARNTDTDAYDAGSTAGHVIVLCQPFSCESDLRQNDSSQFDQTVKNPIVTNELMNRTGTLLSLLRGRGE